jgi:hypothetical protein
LYAGALARVRFDNIFRYQVRILSGGGYTAWGAEATRFEIHRPGWKLPHDHYAFLTCSEHVSSASEEIGMKSNNELRELVRFDGAEPAL